MVRTPPVHAAERERFTEDLLAIMPVEEKVGQLVVARAPDPEDASELAAIRDRLRRGLIGGLVGPCPTTCLASLQRIAVEETRMGIPLLLADTPARGETVIMPSPIALAASWSPETLERVARIIAAEARSRGINWLLGPNVGLSIAGEDDDFASSWGSSSLLIRCLAAATIRGFQFDEEEAIGVLACLRLDNPSWVDRRDAGRFGEKLQIAAGVLREVSPGSIAMKPHSDPRRGMGSPAEGTPYSISRPGGFEGIDLAAWGEIAVAAGREPRGFPVIDLSLDAVVEAVADGRVPIRQIDEAVRRIIRAKYDLGLFHIDERQAPCAPAVRFETARSIALEAARRSITLLRNDSGLLPLDCGAGEVLVVGQAAADRTLHCDGKEANAVSLLDGLEAIGRAHRYVAGLALHSEGEASDTGALADADRMAIGLASEAARRAGSVVIACGSQGPLGEGQTTLIEALRAINPNIVLVTMGSRPHDPIIAGERLPCLLHAGGLGSMAGHAIAEVLTGVFSPQGRLPLDLDNRDELDLSFGHGLSYADFRIAESEVDLGPDRVVVSAVLRNVGQSDGMETVQVYLRRPRGRYPNRIELAAFRQASLAAGQECRLVFELAGSQLGRFEPDGQFSIAPGPYEFSIGLSKARARAARLVIPRQVAEAMEHDLSAEPLPALFSRIRSVG